MVEHLDEIATAVAAAVEQQRAATNQIARNVHQAVTGSDSSMKINRVNGAARVSGDAANDVLGVAHDLTEQATALRQSVRAFLTKVRAA